MRSAVLALLGLLLCACIPTPAQLLRASQWSAAAALKSADPALCEPAMRCSGAVQVLAAPGSGRAEWSEAQAACVLPRSAAGRALIGLDGLAGTVEAVADAVVKHLQEQAAIRRSVLHQATGDLATERKRCRAPNS